MLIYIIYILCYIYTYDIYMYIYIYIHIIHRIYYVGMLVNVCVCTMSMRIYLNKIKHSQWLYSDL